MQFYSDDTFEWYSDSSWQWADWQPLSVLFMLGISSTDAIQINPVNFRKRKKQNRMDFKTLGGKRFAKILGDFSNIEFSLDFISNSDAAIINSWWESDASLWFFETGSTGVEVTSVYIVNDSTPIDGYNAPYTTYRRGKIKLETY